MLELKNVPLSVINRALEIYGEPAEDDARAAWSSLMSAESRIDLREKAHINGNRISPFAQAVAEYISLSGPWDEDHGCHAGENGYRVVA